ncbi:MAG TPA: hypothetical protein VMU87_08600 [Stellaceae bacterium]|nr:hypothetical protein [Stellaceae bacterium]
MDVLISLAATADRLDPTIGALLDHFRDEHVPLQLSLVIVAAAAALLGVLAVWSAIAWARIHRLRRLVRSCSTAAEFRGNFARIDRRLSASLFAGAWTEYRECLKQSEGGILYLRRPDEYLGFHAIASRSFPARFFAAAHGYFIGIGLLFTFIGLVAALKFAAAGVASPDLAVAKGALNALLAAASFKFMTSIAGLGGSLMLSVASRSASYVVEMAAHGLARDLERAMAPVFTEGLAYDQLAATREQLHQLRQIEAALAAPAAPRAAAEGADAANHETLRQILTTFLAEMRGSAGSEMKQLATKLSDVGDAIGHMQSHIGHSGQEFADQLGLAAARLLTAATTLQESVDGRVERVAARIDALAATFARGETLVSTAAEKAASGLLGGFEAFDASLRSQIGSMRDIVGSLDTARQALDASASTWTHCAAPVVASVDASRQITAELGQVAERVGTAQRDMAEMAKAVAQLAERVGIVWDNYRSRFEKVDDELQAVFERLQGGTRAFGQEFMDFIGKLDTSLANGMQAFSLGTEELREVAQMLVVGVDAKAA